ncbi:phospholipase D family protein [Rothia nasimurium]|uniref:phospholipase D family protein n=1 Tax=Rothia nasimurium TaxID=85336 RepID=UPI001F4646ED|nr:phospholipase D family protein [Rothia nasimurium]
MLTVFDLNTRTMLYGPDFWKLTAGYTEFHGVSFVSSFATIDQLSQRFEQVKLILGLEEAKTGSLLRQIFDPTRRVRELETASDPLLDALESGRVHLKYNADKLFHSKYFILTSADEFAILTGSMNLTRAAMTQNHEHNTLYRGRFDSPDDTAYLREYTELFTQNFEVEATDYLDRNTVQEFRQASTTEQRTSIIDTRIIKDAKLLPTEHRETIGQLLREEKSDTATPESVTTTYQLGDPVVLHTLKATYTPAGKTRTPAAAAKSLQTVHLKQRQVVPADASPITGAQPRWVATDDGTLLINHEGKELTPLTDAEVTARDASTFVDIVLSYRDNKMRDESHQALSAFLFAMTAPVLWRIRHLVMETGENPDKIPVLLAILGSGSSGKTTMVDDYLKPFIGDSSPLLAEELLKTTYGSKTGSINYMNSYMESGEVSPLIIDEVGTQFLNGATVQGKIKHWANLRSNGFEGPQGTIILTSNADGAVLQEAIKKRVWYISITSDYKPTDQQVYNFTSLAGSVNSNLYRHVVFTLSQRLDHLTAHEIQRFSRNWVWLTAEILQETLARFGLETAFPAKMFTPYSYRDEIARGIITDTIHQAHAKDALAFSAHSPEVASVLRSAWEATGTFNKTQKEEMIEFRSILPADCVLEATPKAITLNIERTDAYLGEPLLAGYRERSPLNVVTKSEHTLALLEAQRERSEREKAELRLELEAERVALLTRQIQDAEARSRGWGRLWRR